MDPFFLSTVGPLLPVKSSILYRSTFQHNTIKTLCILHCLAIFLRYFEGKRRAERALLDAFPAVGAGIVLRPGFMYGARSVPLPFGGVTGSGLANSVDIPLGRLFEPR